MNLFLGQRFQHIHGAVNLPAGGTLPTSVAFLRLLVEMLQLRPAALGAGGRLGCPQVLKELDLLVTALGIHGKPLFQLCFAVVIEAMSNLRSLLH